MITPTWQTFFRRRMASPPEHFYITHKLERVKELLICDELNITETSWIMDYSSASHLSNQFKKITGLTPSFFMKNKR
jgi:transcriptional regulator GlxA family with amidase domain